MNPLTHSHSFFSLFVSSFQLYRKHFLPMVLLTGVLLIPSMLLGIGGLIGAEILLFFLMWQVLDGAMALGVIGLAFGLTFPIVGILNTLRSRVFWGAMHIAVLRCLLFFGMIGMMGTPFPINVMMVALWLFSLFAFSLAQPVYMVEQIRGMPALARSFKLVRTKLARVFGVFMIIIIMLELFLQSLMNTFISEDDVERLERLQSGLVTKSQVDYTDIIGLFSQSLEIVIDPYRWSLYLVGIFFFPFAAILLGLLYFDLAHRESGFQLERMEQLSRRLFGSPPQGPQAAEPPERPEGKEQ